MKTVSTPTDSGPVATEETHRLIASDKVEGTARRVWLIQMRVASDQLPVGLLSHGLGLDRMAQVPNRRQAVTSPGEKLRQLHGRDHELLRASQLLTGDPRLVEPTEQLSAIQAHRLL